MSSNNRVKFYEGKNLDVIYNHARESIRLNQQLHQHTMEIIIIVIFGGVFINLFSSFIINILINPNDYFSKFYLLLTTLGILCLFLYVRYFIHQYEGLLPEFNIRFSIQELSILNPSIDAILPIFKNKNFKDDNFKEWYPNFKNILLKDTIWSEHGTLNEFSFVEDKDWLFGKQVLFNSSKNKVSANLEIDIIPLPVYSGENFEKEYYHSIQFGISFKILNHKEPYSDEYLKSFYFNLDQIIQSLTYMILLSFPSMRS